MTLDTIEERLRREFNLPDDFHFYKWECFPNTGDTIYVAFTGGGRCPLLSRGKRKGEPNHRKATECQTFNVTITQSDQWEDDYESETGKCRECRGEGKTVWSVGVGGTKYRTCTACGGSGKAALDTQPEKP